jgi:hypothetical protein
MRMQEEEEEDNSLESPESLAGVIPLGPLVGGSWSQMQSVPVVPGAEEEDSR